LQGDGRDKARVRVKSAGFTDTWQWQAAAGRFAPSTLHGMRNGGFEVNVDEKALPPAP